MVSEPDETPELETGTAGASARREHERRHANREKRVREKHPRVGGLMLALGEAPTHETVWARGAGGEEHVAKFLAKYLKADVVALHDRAIPGSRANIDHIVIASSGVWVVDSKRYKGKVAVVKPLFARTKLTINGRDKSKLIDGLAKQVELLKAVMTEVAPNVPVRGALCFVDSDMPARKLTFKGFPLLNVKPLAKRINARGPLAQDHLRIVASELARRFPSA
jgi:hypothetical protein